MADRYLLESGGADGYLLEDGSGVLLLEAAASPVQPPEQRNPVFAKLVTGFVAGNLLLSTLATPFKQTEWPNPKPAKPPAPIAYVNPLSTGLLVHNAIFREPTYALRPTPKPLESQAAPNLLANTLGVATDPFRQTEWPQPVQAARSERAWTNPLSLPLYGKDQFFGEAGQPPANNDWPMPRQAKRLDDLPAIDLLGTTLAIVQLPFSQLDWPQPALNRRIAPPMPEGVELNLIGQDQFFGAAGQPPANTDWPTVQPSPRVPGFNAQNLHQTTLAQPFAQVAWVNPQVRLVAQAATSLNLLGTTLAQVVDSPFFQTQWPLPLAAARGDRAALVNLLTNTLAIVQAVPFAQTDWPNPQLQPRLVPPMPEGVELNLLGKDQFFAAPGMGPNYQWPNPLVRRSGIETPVGSSLLVTTLSVQVTPFAVAQWPNPSKAKESQASLPLNLLETTLVVQVPFAQLDWPNPGLRLRISPPMPEGIELNLLGKDQFFAAPGMGPTYQWPNLPTRRTAIPPLGSSLLVTTLDAQVRPFSAMPWQNAPAAKSPIVSPALNLLVTTLAAEPFRVLVWSNPVGPLQVQRDLAQSLLETTLAPLVVQVPFAQYDWPMPYAPVAAWRFSLTVSGSAEAAATALYGWIEYTVEGRLHYTLAAGKSHYTTEGRLHYTVPDDDP